SLVSSDQAVLGVVSGESVTVKAVGAFADKNVGTDKNVALSYQLTGATANNYKLSSDTQTKATASIAQRKITSVSGVVAADKVYDGTRAADLELSG
ncbi:YDG domain-containing protein, partial [Acinetobacter baumannii]